MRYVLYPKEIDKKDVKIVGGKSANLAELIKAGFPVPECFFVSVAAYEKFLEENKLQEQISDIIKKIDFSNPNNIREGSEKIKSLILKAKIPLEIKESILKAYEQIKAGFTAIRSSATTEDVEKASSAGQQETFLNVRGGENVSFSVQKCWASLFTPRAIYYRHKHKQEKPGIGVIIQRMIDSEKSGVLFTIDPANPENKNITIEAVFGLGETIVQGEVSPDRYVVDKNTGDILEKHIGKKIVERIRQNGVTVKKQVPKQKAESQVLTDKEILVTAAYGKKIEQHYNFPQDVEFAVEKGKLYIVQTRAVTFLEKEKEGEVKGEILLKGLGSSPGIASGTVKIVKNLDELNKIEEGDILVTEMTSPDFVVAMEKASAIITDRGGVTAHASIVSRELGKACIVGTGNATKILKEGEKITVDATKGIVYKGIIEIEQVKKKVVVKKTKTKLKINLAFPKGLEIAEKTDGVGLLRIEHMLTKAGIHPVEYIRQGKENELVNILVENIGKIAKAFYPKPVWVRSLDARTDEFSHMKGGEKEPKEDNPMLGWHGIRRSLDEPNILKAEFTAVKSLHEQGLTNVAIMLPFVIDVSELKKAKELGKNILPKTAKFGIMIETPAAALTIEEFCKEGVDFVSFGTNDLTQTTLAVDRNNENLAKLFNEMHAGVLKLMKNVIKVCRKYKVESSICGEAPSNREEIVDFLVKNGITSISVNIDAVDKVKIWIAEREKKKPRKKVKKKPKKKRKKKKR